MKFDKNGNAILKTIKYPVLQSEYWRIEIDLAIKEKQNRKNDKKLVKLNFLEMI